MSRIHDPAQATRARLLRMAARARAAADDQAVSEGVRETVGLSRARGSAFGSETTGGRTTYRRQTGLDWLAGKGRLTPQQAQVGERYGACYRQAAAEPSLVSTLEAQPGAGEGRSLDKVAQQAARRRQAAEQLALYRARLMGQEDLIAACDLICGREMTPREAGGGEREAGRLEAVLKVALDLLHIGRDHVGFQTAPARRPG